MKYSRFIIGDEELEPTSIKDHIFTENGNVCTIYMKNGDIKITNKNVIIDLCRICSQCGEKIKDIEHIFCDNCLTEKRKSVLEPYINKTKK